MTMPTPRSIRHRHNQHAMRLCELESFSGTRQIQNCWTAKAFSFSTSICPSFANAIIIAATRSRLSLSVLLMHNSLQATLCAAEHIGLVVVIVVGGKFHRCPTRFTGGSLVKLSVTDARNAGGDAGIIRAITYQRYTRHLHIAKHGGKTGFSPAKTAITCSLSGPAPSCAISAICRADARWTNDPIPE